MRFNTSKFEILRYSQDDSIKLCTSYLSNACTIIDKKEEVRDLGVVMSNNFTFQAHINNIIEKDKHTAAWILRTFQSRSKDVMITLWKSLAIQKIEYCSQLWCLLKIGDIQRIEIIQWSSGIDKSFFSSVRSRTLWYESLYVCVHQIIFARSTSSYLQY